ncbi:TIGR03086 family protein [Streptomyces cinnamoneus]|uniref:TIGR03086 family protein n=1 Tax=Streptomyces cinnamoneus TaxID=53446 RepID=A0A2G1XKU8_STRCJ|nr:TIGR03086 family metal-binding protein [Streptomyces cinnamoneus]PHQ51850.1 TIGR03086 family protein [Streptomyces cinnamoneus]PPT16314.1 TIGR03086 family protein [Streptomyces cinnamoneus]
MTGDTHLTDSRRRTLLARHGEALDLFTDRVHAVGPAQWGKPTPCTEWTVRDLVNHLAVEQMWVPLLLDGAAVEDVGDALDGDKLGEDPVDTWDRAAADAREAFHARGALQRTVQLSYGASAAHAYCAQMIADLVVHAWDLSRAIGAPERPPNALVEFTRHEVEPYADGLAGSGLFARPVQPPPEADSWERLLAQLGRQP